LHEKEARRNPTRFFIDNQTGQAHRLARSGHQDLVGPGLLRSPCRNPDRAT